MTETEGGGGDTSEDRLTSEEVSGKLVSILIIPKYCLYQDTPTHSPFEADFFGDPLLNLNESSINLEEVPAPERVLVFTSVKLLGLLTACKKGSLLRRKVVKVEVPVDREDVGREVTGEVGGHGSRFYLYFYLMIDLYIIHIIHIKAIVPFCLYSRKQSVVF